MDKMNYEFKFEQAGADSTKDAPHVNYQMSIFQNGNRGAVIVKNSDGSYGVAVLSPVVVLEEELLELVLVEMKRLRQLEVK